MDILMPGDRTIQTSRILLRLLKILSVVILTVLIYNIWVSDRYIFIIRHGDFNAMVATIKKKNLPEYVVEPFHLDNAFASSDFCVPGDACNGDGSDGHKVVAMHTSKDNLVVWIALGARYAEDTAFVYSDHQLSLPPKSAINGIFATQPEHPVIDYQIDAHWWHVTLVPDQPEK